MAPRRISSRQVLTLRTLGAWGLRFGDAPESEADSSPSKSLGLLVYLACSPGASARRERLVDLLWAHMEPDAGDHALRQTVWHLRNRLGEETIASSAGALILACRFECDRTSFLEAIESQDFEAAVRLYGGEFLPGFAAPGGAEFERWADLERRRLQGFFVLAAENVTHRWLAAGRLRDATALARRALDTNRDSEAGWRLLLEALGAANDSVSAAVEAEELRRTLAEDGRMPEPATDAAIRRALHEHNAAVPSPGALLVTELIGRERQFTIITQAWDAVRAGPGRHVHVEGAPGIGKTRLLHDVATRLRASGAMVLEGRANPGEQGVRYALAASLAAALAALPGSGAVAPASADALVALNPQLSNRYPAASRGIVARGYDVRVLFLALANLVDTVTDETPLALMIDDVHWGDSESRGLLAALLPRLTGSRVLLITSARPGPEGRIERPDTAHVVLEPLSAEQVSLLIASAGSLPKAEWAAGLAEALHRTTLGSPLLIIETLRLTLSRDLLRLAEGEWDSTDPVALFALLAQGGALHQRIVDLTRERRWLLTLLSFAGVPLSQRVLADAARHPQADIVADVDELSRLGLALRSDDAWAPGHDAIAERVMELAASEQRLAAHAALGRALMAQSDDETLLRAAVQHLAAASLDREAEDVARRWVRVKRASGDRRSVSILVSDLVGLSASDRTVRRLVRALPLTARLRRSLAAGVGAVAVATAVAGYVVASRSGARDPGVFVGQWRHEATGHWRLFGRTLTAADLASGRLSLNSLSRTDVLGWDRAGGDLKPDASGELVAWRAFRDAGGEDLILTRAERMTRLTSAPGDDYAASWSPDGRWIAFSTDRWSQSSQSAIAVMDPSHPNVLRRLTKGETTRDVLPVWSPDGSRVVFVRTHILAPSSSELCVVTVDGVQERCSRVPGYEFLGLAAWSSAREVAGVFRDSAGSRQILSVDVLSGASHRIAEGEAVAISRAPGWVSCFCRRTRDEPMQLLAMPLADLGRAVRLEPAAPPGGIQLFGSARPASRLDRLKIANAPAAIPADGSWHLDLQGWDGAGQPREPLAVRWWTSDSSIATVDSSGDVHPARRGSVTVFATSGGWRTDSVTLEVRGFATVNLLEEDWRDPLTSQWVLYGTPRPFIFRTPAGSALAPNGDSTFQSGVFTRRLMPTRDGLGVHFRASTPVSMTQWQNLEVSILTADSLTTAGWDLVKGQVESADLGWRSCGLTYPRAGGHADEIGAINGTRASIRVPRAVARGEWTLIRIQLFPDGRCGLAINGQPKAILEQTVPMGDSAMLMIGGYSYNTRILVGPLEVWRGVRRDIDWSRAEDGRR